MAHRKYILKEVKCVIEKETDFKWGKTRLEWTQRKNEKELILQGGTLDWSGVNIKKKWVGRGSLNRRHNDL